MKCIIFIKLTKNSRFIRQSLYNIFLKKFAFELHGGIFLVQLYANECRTKKLLITALDHINNFTFPKQAAGRDARLFCLVSDEEWQQQQGSKVVERGNWKFSRSGGEWRQWLFAKSLLALAHQQLCSVAHSHKAAHSSGPVQQVLRREHEGQLLWILAGV